MHAVVQMRIDDQAAADKGIDKQVQKTLQIAATSGHQLGHAGGCGITHEAHGGLGKGLQLGTEVNVVPLIRHAGGQAQHLVPTAQIEGRGQADTDQAQRPRAQTVLNGCHMGLNGRQQGLGIGEGVTHGLAPAHRTGEIHQQQVGAATSNLDAQRKRAVRVQCHWHRGLANAPTHRFVTYQQAVFLQPPRDHAYGLGGQAGQSRQLCLRKAAIEANGLQHHALIELAHAHMVGAARTQHRWRSQRPDS